MSRGEGEEQGNSRRRGGRGAPGDREDPERPGKTWRGEMKTTHRGQGNEQPWHNRQRAGELVTAGVPTRQGRKEERGKKRKLENRDFGKGKQCNSGLEWPVASLPHFLRISDEPLAV